MADHVQHRQVGDRVRIAPRSREVDASVVSQPFDGMRLVWALSVKFDLSGVLTVSIGLWGGGDELVDAEVIGQRGHDLHW